MIYDMDQQIYLRSDGLNEIIIGGGNETGLNISDGQGVPAKIQKEELNAWLESSFSSEVSKIVLKSEGLCSEPADQKPIVGKLDQLDRYIVYLVLVV